MMSRSNKTSVWIPFLLLVCCGVASAQRNDGFFGDFSTPGLPGRLMVPPESGDSPRPAILFLHGAGETGTNNTSQINGNINSLVAAAQDRGAFVYAPQATSFGWSESSRTDLVMSMVDQMVDEHNVDSNRIYVTGLSMGGGGSWMFASRYSDRFAANVPIAGISPGRRGFDPADFQHVPTWAYHARDDGIVSVEISRGIVNEIRAAAGERPLAFPAAADPTLSYVNDSFDLRYTEFRNGGHNIWSTVYGSEEMHDWMFAKSIPEPSSGVTLLLASCLGVVVFRNRQRWGGRAR